MAVSELLCLVRPILGVLSKIFKSIKCHQLVAIVSHHKSGKSHFINSVQSKDWLILDLEENVKINLNDGERDHLNKFNGNTSFSVHYYPLCKKYLDSVEANHKGRNIIVFCSDLDLVKYLKIKQVYSFAPSNNLSEMIRNNITDENDQKKYDENRLTTILNAGAKLITFNSFDDFSNKLITKFKLQQKL
jgi:predicted lipase